MGYPDFRVLPPPRILPMPVTLKRIALAKISDITAMSAAFGGERILFEPWLTLLIDYGDSVVLTGAYRSDSASCLDEANDPALPIWCLRQSAWSREMDVEQARRTDDLREYLSSGHQVTNRLVFANRASRPEVDGVMSKALGVLRSGIRVEPVEPRSHHWEFVTLDVADDKLICRIEFSPLTASSEALETALPPWITQIDNLLEHDSFSPDGPVTISIRRSVSELIHGSAALRRLS